MVCAPVWSIIPSLKLGDYFSVQAHKPCSISHISKLAESWWKLGRQLKFRAKPVYFSLVLFLYPVAFSVEGGFTGTGQGQMCLQYVRDRTYGKIFVLYRCVCKTFCENQLLLIP